MNWVNKMIFKIAFLSETFYHIFNEFVSREVETKEITAVACSSLDSRMILNGRDLRIVDDELVQTRSSVMRVVDEEGKTYILKLGGIPSFQVGLLEATKRVTKKICFRVPLIVDKGDGCILLEDIRGKSLSDCREEMQKVKWMLLGCNDDYPEVIQEFQKTQPLGNLLKEGREWLYTRLGLWSEPIVDAGLIEFSYIRQLKKEFDEIIAKKGESFFGWAHGDITFEHVIVSEKECVMYLLDLNAVARPGRRYYDFLKSLGCMFLESKNPDEIFHAVCLAMDDCLFEFNQKEVRLVFAFCCIEMLSQKILSHNIECMLNEDMTRRKELLLRFIKREY